MAILNRSSPALFKIFIWFLFTCALLRVATLCFNTPLLGLANNYDMIRIQGCIDAYPIRNDGLEAWHNSYLAPIGRYEFREDIKPGCYFSSEALFAWVAYPFMRWESHHSMDGGFSLKWMASVKFVTFSLLFAYLLTILLKRKQIGFAASFALVGLIVAADPGITIFYNTMYAEFTSFLFGFCCIGLTFVLLTNDKKPTWIQLMLLSTFILLMGFSKIQHILFGVIVCFALALSIVITRSRAPKCLVRCLVISTLIVILTQSWNIQKSTNLSMKQANLTNTVLAAVLGESNHPEKTTALLGLPKVCADHAGKNWFNEALQKKHPCPEIFSLSRLQILALSWKDSFTFFRVLSKAAKQTRPWLSVFLGKVEGKKQAALPKYFVSFDSLINAMPTGLYLAWLTLSPILGLLIAWNQKNEAYGLAKVFVLLFLSGFPIATLATVAFGDGLVDVSKQSHLMVPSLVTLWIILALIITNKFQKK